MTSRETLELTQATQMLRWLDDEHRKDKQVLTEMQKRIETQNELIISLGRRITDLEGRLTGTQGQPRPDAQQPGPPHRRTRRAHRDGAQ